MRIVLLIPAAIACSDPKPGAPTGEKAPPTARAPRGNAVCEALVPAAMRADLTLEASSLGGLLTCNFSRGKQRANTVQVTCILGSSVDSFNRANDRGREPVIGLGRAAFKSGSQYELFASKVDCTIKVITFGREPDLALAKAVDAALDPTNAPVPTPTSGIALRCDDVVPAALRERLGTTERTEQAAAGDRLSCRYTTPPATARAHEIRAVLECAGARQSKTKIDFYRKGQKDAGRFEADVAIGKDGFSEAGNKISFVDAQTDCVVEVTSADNPAAAREIEAAITPATIK